MELGQFTEWFNMSADPIGNFDMELIRERANTRFQESKASNPNFYYGPFTGMIARNAGYIFPTRLFANYSKENTEGSFSRNTVNI
jgi:hypothetical protein